MRACMSPQKLLQSHLLNLLNRHLNKETGLHDGR